MTHPHVPDAKVIVVKADTDPDIHTPGHNWLVKCQPHGFRVTTVTRAQARKAASEPECFCPGCAALVARNEGKPDPSRITRTTISLPLDLLRRVDLYAEKTERSNSWVIRAALKDFLDQRHEPQLEF